MPGLGEGLVVSGSLVQPDGETPFVPDGVSTAYRVRVDLTGDGTASPFVYGASVEFEPTLANTPDTPTTLDDWILRATLNVPESPADVTFSLLCKAPDAIEDAGAAGITTQENRSLEAKIGSIAIINGRTNTPHFTDSYTDEARELVLETRDRCRQLEKYEIKDPIPVDGLRLDQAFEYFATLPGFSSADMDIEEIDFPLPTIPGTSQGEYALLPEVGDHPLEWLHRLWETYAQNYWWGWVPTISGPKFRVRSLEAMFAQASCATIWGTLEDAKAGYIADGYSDDDAAQFAYKAVYREYRETPLALAANDIYVTGRNPRTGKPIQTHYADYVSQDATLAVSARPDNWYGEPLPYGYVDSALVTQEACNWSAITLGKRLFRKRNVGEHQGEFLLKPDGSPVWRGDKITVNGVGDIIVNTIGGEFEREHSSEIRDAIWRPFTYTGEKA